MRYEHQRLLTDMLSHHAPGPAKLFPDDLKALKRPVMALAEEAAAAGAEARKAVAAAPAAAREVGGAGRARSPGLCPLALRVWGFGETRRLGLAGIKEMNCVQALHDDAASRTCRDY